jgi:hypothetical protein
MSKTRLVLSSLATVLAFAVTASSASAAIKFEWKVDGVLLGAGEDREFTMTSDGKPFDLNGTAFGTSFLLLAKEAEDELGARIIGGRPGKDEETIIFKNVTVDKPPKCVVESEGSPTGTIKTSLLKTEIVEKDVTPREPLILFTPKSATSSVFLSLLFLDKGTEICQAAGSLVNVTGSLLAEPLPSLKETLTGDLDFEASNKNFVLSSGGLDSAGLEVRGEPWTLTGLALVILDTGEQYGAF